MKKKETLTESIKHLGDLDERPAELREAIFNRLFEQAEIAKYTPVERQDYEESLKNFRDWYSCLVTAERKGRAEERLSIARNLKASGALTISQIAMATNLTEDEVEKA